MFISRPEHYTRNIADGQALTIRPALLNAPTGQEAGVVVLHGNAPRYVLREDHALALANAIVDSLEAHRRRSAA